MFCIKCSDPLCYAIKGLSDCVEVADWLHVLYVVSMTEVLCMCQVFLSEDAASGGWGRKISGDATVAEAAAAAVGGWDSECKGSEDGAPLGPALPSVRWPRPPLELSNNSVDREHA